MKISDKNPYKYLYIGSEIYSFNTIEDDVIIDYFSDIGNNDVPYPYAIGEKYIYFMLERYCVEKFLFTEPEDPEDPGILKELDEINLYQVYYWGHLKEHEMEFDYKLIAEA